MEHCAVQSQQADHVDSLSVRVYSEISALEKLSNEWNVLLDKSTYHNVFLRWEWIERWWKWFGKGRKLHVIVVRDGSEVVGIVPLYFEDVRCGYFFRGNKLAFIGSGGPTCPEYLGPIVHRDYVESVINLVTNQLLKSPGEWDFLEFPDIPPDDTTSQALIEALQATNPFLCYQGEVCCFLELPEDYESLLKRVTRNRRRQERVRLRNAKQTFKVELKRWNSVEDVRSNFPAICQLSTSARVIHGEHGPFNNPEYAGFHQDIIERMLESKNVAVYLLSFDGSPVAFRYGFIFHDKFYDFQTGFESSLGEYRPGDVCLQLVFDDLMQNGVKEFDFLRGDHNYKRHFADKERQTGSTLVFSKRGVFLINRWARMNIIPKLRNWVKKCMPSVNKSK